MDTGTVERVDIEQKMRSAYLSYAMSVITARALPDVRDGLKPVQRRILYAMHDMGLRHDQPPRKSARIVGEVLGKYHPHGDSAVYDAMVRMAQDFSMRYMLVDGQGNFGSVDGDGAAALRYTEARLSAIGEELLLDLDKDTVDFGDNFDGSLQEPQVLPAKLPNLLLNGVGGIAVGMATSIPPHNLSEIADAITYLLDHYSKLDSVTVDDLLQFVQGPDFPTGGTVLGREGIRQAYATGKGRIVVRAQAHVEELRAGYQAIIVTELPYQVNKANMVERIADLVREGRIEGISDLRDESDRTGMRVVVELKRGVGPGPILSQLLRQTQMQSTFGVNMLTLVDGEPRTLSLKRILVHYIEHRYDVIMRRTRFELERARARAHILEGLLKALDHLDEVIDTIRRSQTAETARTNLCKKFGFTEIQAQAILDMQLRRLAALERRKLQDEYAEILKRIAYLEELLASKQKVLGIIKDDILELKRLYGDARRTRISDADETTEFRTQDLVPDENLVLMLTQRGHVARMPVSAYVARRDEIVEALTRDRDTFLALLPGHSQDTVLFVTNTGRAYGLPAHQLPELGPQARGLPFTNLIHTGSGEHIVAAIPLNGADSDRLLFLGTQQGRVKRLALSDIASAGRSPLEVMSLPDGDVLGWAMLTRETDEVMLVSEGGRAIRFQAETVRPQGRSATGMRGITLNESEVVVSLDLVRDGGELLLVTALGYAKRTALTEYTPQGRGGQGAQTVDGSKMKDTGPVVAARVVLPGEEVAFGTATGAMTVMPVKDVPALGRITWGRLVTRTRRNAAVQLDEGDAVNSLACLDGVAMGETKSPPPTRRSTARRARASETVTAETGATETSTAQSQEDEAAAAKPTRRTRASAKGATASGATTKAPTRTRSSAKAAQPADEAPEAEPAAPKPARRRTAAAKADDAQEPKPATTRRRAPSRAKAPTPPVEDEDGQAATAAQDKPARSRSTSATTSRTRAAARPEPTAAPEAEREPPARRSRTATRRPAATAATPDEETSGSVDTSTGAPNMDDQNSSDETKPAVRRTRRTTTTRAPRRTRTGS
jgi:DNA gyrase subunit A